MADPNEGTYADESPDAGIADRVVGSFKKIAQGLGGKRETPPMGAANPNNSAALSEAGLHPDEHLSKLRSNQSTDSDNGQ